MTPDVLSFLFTDMAPRRGVFCVAADPGQVVLRSIASTGKKFMQWEMPESVFDPEFVQLMWELLDVGDPVLTLRMQREEPS